MKGFRKRLQGAIDASQYSNNVWKLALDAGLGKKSVWSILNNEGLDVSQTGPGLFGMARVANLLGTSLDHLAGLTPPIRPLSPESSELLSHAGSALSGQQIQTGTVPTADGLLRLFAKSGGMLKAFEGHLDHCDQYAAIQPGDDSLTVLEVGSKSLSAITMAQSSKELLQKALNTVPDDALKSRWVADYSETLRGGPKVTLEGLDVQMPNHPVRVKMEFIRVLLPVNCENGPPRILNFSLLIL